MRTCVNCGRLDKDHVGAGMACPDLRQNFVAMGASPVPYSFQVTHIDPHYQMQMPYSVPFGELSELRRKAALWDKACEERREFLVELKPDGSAIVESMMGGARRRISLVPA